MAPRLACITHSKQNDEQIMTDHSGADTARTAAHQGNGDTVAAGPWGSGDNNKPGERPNPWGQAGQKPEQPKPQTIWGDRSQNGGGSGGSGGSRGPGNSGGGLPGGDMLKRFGNGRMIFMGLIVLAVVWALSGFYRVNTGSIGVVTTFGQLTAETDEGLRWRIPSPVQSVAIVNVSEVRTTDIGFTRSDRGGPNRDVAAESLMLTGDENIIDIDLTILWRVGSPTEYLFNVRDPEQTVKIAAESALREVVGTTNISTALTTGRAVMEARMRELLQDILNSYQAGIQIDNIQLQNAQPPAQVKRDFDDVQKANQDRSTEQNQANRDAKQAVELANGEAAKILADAEAQKQKLVNEAEGTAQRFTDLLTAYQVNPTLTRQRLYIEAMEDIFSRRNAIIIDKDLAGGNLIINAGPSDGTSIVTVDGQ